MGLEGQRALKPKMANMECLRCIAMMMVVVLHYLGKSSLLADLTQENMGGAGVVDAHELLFFKGKILFHVQSSFSFVFRGLDLRRGCCG